MLRRKTRQEQDLSSLRSPLESGQPGHIQAAGSGLRWLRIAQVVIALWLAFCVVRVILASISWPMVQDGAIVSYIVFLIDHGMAPYREIIETSFPGSYLAYWLGIHTFGSSALGFMLFDYTIMAAAAIAMFSISLSRKAWLAGAVGAVTLFVAHIAGNCLDSAQRDFIMAALELCGCACTFLALRRKLPVLLFFAGFAFSFATAIKPTAALFFLILFIAILRVRRQGIAIRKYVSASIIGAALAAAIVVTFLVREGSFFAFFDILGRLDAVHGSLRTTSFLGMIYNLFFKDTGRLLLLPVVLLWAAQRDLRKSFELQMLLLCVVLGMASFLVQQKGWHYHLYPFLAFESLWIALVLVETLRQPGRLRYVAGALLCVVLFLELPLGVKHSVSVDFPQDFLFALQSDLTSAGALNEDGSVQCMEMVSGCTNVLYRMKLKQATGFIADYYFFLPEKYSIVLDLRNKYLHEIEQKRPRTIVITDDVWPPVDRHHLIRSYDQINKWPDFAQYLSTNYHLAVERTESDGGLPAGYRMYVRN